jgi:hypothetical protein
MENLQALKHHVDRLHKLLADQEPGLFTWCIFVGENWKAITKLWFQEVKRCSVEDCEESGQMRFCGIWICAKHSAQLHIHGAYPRTDTDGFCVDNPMPEGTEK